MRLLRDLDPVADTDFLANVFVHFVGMGNSRFAISYLDCSFCAVKLHLS